MVGTSKMEIGKEGRISTSVASLGTTLKKVWQGLREWSGDAAYETYVRCAAKQRAAQVLSREEFYVEQLKRKYSRVSRCC
jgi:uncharacterized short protein YbdD (DUF466 family)